jgi:N-acetylmuramic acid 6-phosphate etherase
MPKNPEMAQRTPSEDGPLTEHVLESSQDLDRRSVAEILETIHAEDVRAAQSVRAVLPEVAQAVELLVDVLEKGGRWFNVGAGTSGRLGCADAAEIPPTFGYAPERILGVIAGGAGALARALEGAEDDQAGARQQLSANGLAPGDAVVALSASGQTPFALAALELAREVGARRIAVTCDPDSPLARSAEIAIAPQVGAEVIAGSTRMKGGLVEKMVLHLLSTTAMVRLGRVEGNRMSNLRPASQKLKRRAIGIVRDLGQVDEARARELLERCRGSVANALRAARDEG